MATPTTISSVKAADQYEVERLLRALNKTHLNLRIFSLFLLATSLFFLGWSILSFFFTVQYLSFFGVLIFFTSILTSCFLLTDYAARTGCCTRANFFFSQLGNAIYFFVSAVVSRNLSYGKGWTIAAAAIFVLSLGWSIVGYILLVRVQKLTEEYMTMEICDTESEEFISEDPNNDNDQGDMHLEHELPSSSSEEGDERRDSLFSEEEEERDDSFSEKERQSVSKVEEEESWMEKGQMDDSHSSGDSSSDFEVEQVVASGANEDEFEVEYRG